jgi:tetratricopeptide (TPR) repeat protein
MPHTYGQGDEPVPGSGYRLSSFLGRGGFGEVWKATAPGGAEAALKIIHLGGTEGRKEFRALQLVKRIRHPNLVPIIGFWLKGKDGTILDDAFAGQDYLPKDETHPATLRETMVAPPDVGRPQAAELIVAMGLGDLSLFDRLEQCRAQGIEGIPPDELLGYMEDVAQAIDFLNRPVHDLGSGPAAIQHCDIKPHNLMIVGGAAQICDFGLARMMGADQTTTAAATIAYAAPECLQTGKPSASTDQYSLAVSYYELRTGALPYRDETLAAVMAAKEQGKLDFSRLTTAEQAVLHCATTCDPAQRFPSAVAMVKALSKAFATATAPTQSVVFRPAARRGRRLVAPLVALILLAGAALGGWFLWPHLGAGLPHGGAEGVAVHPTRTNPPPPPPPGIEQADACAERGDWNAATTIYTDIADGQSAPEIKARARFGLGRSHLEQHDYNAAIADFEEAVRLDRDNRQGFQKRKEYVDAHLSRGMRRLRDQQYDRAIDDLQRVREIVPGDARAASCLGQAWLAKNDFHKAVEQFTAALAIRPSADDRIARGHAYLQLDRRKEALADFGEAIRLDDRSAAAHYYRGTALLAEKNYAAAAADFEKVISLDPQGDLGIKSRKACADACLELGTAALEKGDYDKAIPYFDQASKYDSGNARIYDRRAVARYRKSDFAKAIKDYTTLIGIESNDSNYVRRGLAWQQSGDLDKAVADFGEAIRLNPRSAQAFARRGGAYAAKFEAATTAKADLDRAIADLTTAVDICHKYSDADFSLTDALRSRAPCYMWARQYDRAAGDFAEIISLDPKSIRNSHDVLDELAARFAEEGKFPKAVEWETKAVEFAPDADTKAEYRARLEKYQAGKL